MSNIYEAMGLRNCQDHYNVRLVTTGPKRWGEATRDEGEFIHETGYMPERKAEQEFDTWGASLAEAAASGLLDILQEPGWLTLELVSHPAEDASSKPGGWVIGVREIEQRFPADLEPDPWLHITESVVHEVKPVWCDECDAYHVECEFGCCAIEV